MAKPRICSIEGCGKPSRGHGWCSAHYSRWRNHGDPEGGGPAQTPIGEPMRFFRDVALLHEGDECLIWPYTRSRGYAQIWLDGRMRQVSILVCEAVNGPPPTADHECAHSCGNGHLGCISPHHVGWKTHAGNMADQVSHGTKMAGEKHGMAKLTADEVREIRASKGRISQYRLAAHYGVSRPTIRAIHHGRSWKSLP